MDWLMGGIAIILLVVGLVGQAFEMRRIRISTTQEGELGSPNIFTGSAQFQVVCADRHGSHTLVCGRADPAHLYIDHIYISDTRMYDRACFG